MTRIASLAAIAAFVSAMGVGASSAVAVTFDCAKASKPVEHMICEDHHLSKLDDEMAEAFKAASAAASNSNLEAEQRAWIAKRDACTRSNCVAVEYRKRIIALTAIARGKGAHPATPQANRDSK